MQWFQREQAAQHEPEDVDPDIAAMMGFGGFGSSKKWIHSVGSISLVTCAERYGPVQQRIVFQQIGDKNECALMKDAKSNTGY